MTSAELTAMYKTLGRAGYEKWSAEQEAKKTEVQRAAEKAQDEKLLSRFASALELV